MALTTVALSTHKPISRAALLAVAVAIAALTAIVVAVLSMHGSGSHVVAHLPIGGAAQDLIRFGRAS